MEATLKVKFGDIEQATGHRIVLYGPGGIGKTTLAASLPGKTAFFDLDESLPRLRGQLDATGAINNIANVSGCRKWGSLKTYLANDGWDGIDNIVIDTLTRAEEMCVQYTLETVQNEKGFFCKRIEDYGYGKGYQYVFDTFLPLLTDIDKHCRAGRNVVLICHDCTATVPNPSGDDWIRYEPRLQSPASGKASIRLRVKEWADHVLFIGYNVSVDNDGKGHGAGLRTLYPAELPLCMAKSRTCATQIIIGKNGDGSNVWKMILGEITTQKKSEALPPTPSPVSEQPAPKPQATYDTPKDMSQMPEGVLTTTGIIGLQGVKGKSYWVKIGTDIYSAFASEHKITNKLEEAKEQGLEVTVWYKEKTIGGKKYRNIVDVDISGGGQSQEENANTEEAEEELPF